MGCALMAVAGLLAWAVTGLMTAFLERKPKSLIRTGDALVKYVKGIAKTVKAKAERSTRRTQRRGSSRARKKSRGRAMLSAKPSSLFDSINDPGGPYTMAVTFHNTRAHSRGLREGEVYRANPE